MGIAIKTIANQSRRSQALPSRRLVLGPGRHRTPCDRRSLRRTGLLLGAAFLIFIGGCARTQHSPHEARHLVPLKQLAKELHNPEYVWYGPTSNEDRIPSLPAAQALAYRGDSSAFVLFNAVDDPNIDIISVLDALSNLGIPVHQFHLQILDRNSTPVRDWWEANQARTQDERNEHRQMIGLPPTTIH